jgi:AraC-like DNA-binding protein
MQLINQEAAVDPGALGGGDHVHFWRAQRHDGLEGLTATFRCHRFAPHTHETYAIGIILAGRQTDVLRGERHCARAGDLLFINPGDVHDGEPAGTGYAYRMSYPSVAFMREIALELSGRDDAPAPYFPRGTARDPIAAAAFVLAHTRLEANAEPIESDEALVGAYAVLLQRHATSVRSACPASAPRGVARVRDFLEAHYADAIDLANLAALAGLTRCHLVRAFKRAFRLTPHAYLTDCRVRAARRMLATGAAPADVAAACGFSDQSHLTRVFKLRTGVPPGSFRAA